MKRGEPTNFPRAFDQVQSWAHDNATTVVEARLRFAQFGMLVAVGRSRFLRSVLVLKGGNALNFVWEANRSTRDLDFSVDGTELDEEQLGSRLTPALDAVERELGITYRIHRIDRQPPGQDKTFVTLHAKVGFALPDDNEVRQRLLTGRPSPHVVPLDVSLNEPVCASETADFAGNPVRVCTVEDIVAEKLRALLQQSIRNRNRRQDVLDIAVLLNGTRPLDTAAVRAFLLRKASARNVPVSRSAFYRSELARRASVDYEDLKATTRSTFLEFDEAFKSVLQLVDSLELSP